MMKTIVTILGPTATGKTSLATLFASKYDAEIVSADSRQVYRNMDLGTGKDLADYHIEETAIPYHMIDVAEPGIEYNVFHYQQAVIPIMTDIQKREKLVVFCGGSGMYLEAILKGYKMCPVPENRVLREKLALKNDQEIEEILSSYKTLHNKTDLETRKRAYRAIEIEEYYANHPELLELSKPIPSVIFGLKGDRDLIRTKITRRLHERLNEGMIDEVQKLIDTGVNPHQLIRYGLEYKYLTLFLQNKISYETMFQQLNIAIHQFSKRQMTWFRKMERNGFKIHWMDIEITDREKISLMQEICKKEGVKI